MTTTVMVTGVGGGIGMSIVKALVEANRLHVATALDLGYATDPPFRIVGADAAPLSPGLFVGVDTSTLVQKASGHAYIDSITSACAVHGVDVLIPGTDHELKVLAAAKERVEEATATRLLISPWWSVRKMRDKRIMAEWLTANGFQAPRTSTYLYQGGPVYTPAGWPMVLKPIDGSGSGDTHVVSEEDDDWPIPRGRLYCAQEYLEGDEFTTSVLVGRDGLVYDIMTLRRLSPKLGEGHQLIARQTWDPGDIATKDLVEIAEGLKTLGCCNIQWKYRGLRPVPFEINMRFPGSTVICAAAGMNGPRMAVEDLLTGNRTHDPHRSLICLRHLSEVYVPSGGHAFTMENLQCASSSPEGLATSDPPWSLSSTTPR